MVSRPLGLDPADPLVQSAVLGLQTEEWLKGPVGTFVMNRVRQRLARLELDLKGIDPTKAMDIAKIQAEIKHWEGFAGWIGEAIQAYHTAVAIIDGEQDAPEDT